MLAVHGGPPSRAIEQFSIDRSPAAFLAADPAKHDPIRVWEQAVGDMRGENIALDNIPDDLQLPSCLPDVVTCLWYIII